jgi:hypothetical protein
MITQSMRPPEGLPEDVLDTFKLFVFKRLRPGQFLMAVLSNDLQKAVGHADDNSMKSLRRIVQFVYFDLPSDCWGSPEKVRAWLSGAGDPPV